MRASGARPRSRASAALATTMAAAPSEIDEDDAAVTVPSLPNAGFSAGIFADVDREGRLVLGDRFLALARLHRDRRDLGGEIAVASRRAAPGARTRPQRRPGRRAYTRTSPQSGRRSSPSPGRPRGSAGRRTTCGRRSRHAHAITRARLEQQVRRIGHRLEAAGQDRCARCRRGSGLPASITAFMPEPHILLMVVAGMLERQAGIDCRLARRAWPRPAGSTQPKITSSIRLGPRPASASAAAGGSGTELGGVDRANTPWKAPIGVRRAAAMTSLVGHWVFLFGTSRSSKPGSRRTLGCGGLGTRSGLA